MTYSRHKPFLCLVGAAVLGAMAFSGCAGSPPPTPAPPRPPPFVAQEVSVKLGEQGGTLTLMTTQSGGYTRDGQPFQSGTTIEANDNSYKLTLDSGTWSAEYVPPEPSEVALGTSGDTLSVTREEDGSYQAGDATFESGDVLAASNGNMYRLTFKDEGWLVEYVAPDPVSVELGTSGESLTLTRTEDGTYETADGEPLPSGGIRETANGNSYRLTLMDGEWSHEYVAPDPVSVELGTSGESLTLTRAEDGTYETADGEPLPSGGIWKAANGNSYRLTLMDGEWSHEYVAPDPVSVELGTSGESLTLTRTEDGTYETADGEPLPSGGIRETASGNSYELTLAGGAWSAEYVPPEPSAVALGTSGDALLVTRKEDGSYQADDTTFESGDVLAASNGNMYRLTFKDEGWLVEYVAPDPVSVELGASGESLTLTRGEDGTYETADGEPFQSGGIWKTASGSDYKLTLMDGEWSHEYVAPDPVSVELGTSGETVQLTRREDGTYETGDGEPFQSGRVWKTASGSDYKLTLTDGEWSYEYVTPDPISVELGASGESLALTRREDGTYETGDGELFESGRVWKTASGSDYRLTLMDGKWSYEYVPPAPFTVPLGRSGQTLELTRREDGRYEADGRLIASNETIEAENGNMYRLTLVGNEWTAEFVPRGVTVRLGTSGSSIILTREEDGQYWLGRTPFQSGTIRTAANGGRYRVSLKDGEWDADYIPEAIQVEAGESGTTLALLRLEDGTYFLDGQEVQSGDTVTVDGNEYVLSRTGNTWSAEFKTGSVVVDLPGGGTVTLTKEEGGTYTLDGTVVRSGSTRLIGGVRYRLTLGPDGWRATRRVIPTTPVGPGGPGNGGTSDRTETDEKVVEFGVAANFRLCDKCSSDAADEDEGTFLEVGPTGNTAEYSLYELLGRSGIVSQQQTYVEAAKDEVESIVERIKNFDRVGVYENEGIDPDEHINTGLDGEPGLWTQALNAVKKVFSTYDRSHPWGRDNEVDVSDVDDVIEELEEIVDALSSLSEFEDEFESLFAADKDAEDYFQAPTSRLKVGSTRNTRFGVYSNNSDESLDIDMPSWASGAFAYSPLGLPDADDLPTRGEATYRGSTVAVDLDDHRMYSGTIELRARFSTQRVDGAITDLEDDDGDPWTHSSNDVESVLLPTAEFSDEGSIEGDGTASIRFPAGSLSDDDISGGEFDGQFLNGGAEVLGTWKIPSLLEGAFGIGRTSTSSATRPSVNDRGAESETSLDNNIEPDGNGDIEISDVGFEATQLYRNKGGSDTGELLVRTAKAEIDKQASRLRALINAETPITTTIGTEIFNAADSALDMVFGSSNPVSSFSSYPTGTDKDEDAKDLLGEASRALSSTSRFEDALETDEIFADLGIAVDQVDDIFKAVPYKLTVEFDYTNSNYTRFGAWSKPTREHATDVLDTSDTGVFAYSSLDQTNYSTDPDLSFRAIYEGGTVAVDSDGSIYQGFIQLTVEWAADATNAVSSFIRDLKDVSDSSYLQHDSQEVGYISFDGLTVNNTGDIIISGSASARIRYRDKIAGEVDITGTEEMSGKFVGNSIDGPLGVIGEWRVVETGGINIKGAFGAELLP